MSTRRSIPILFGILSVVLFASESRAQFSALQQVLFRATELGGNRNYLSTPQGGPLFDNNIFDQRVEFNRLGQGFAFDSFRFFGPDSFDNPNTIDLGPLKVQLGRDPAVLQSTQPVGVHTRVGFTTTLIPEVTFDTKTGQRGFDIFSGQTNFISAPLNYNVDFNTGVQNYNWNGNLFVDSKGSINTLGFYDIKLRVTNVGNTTAEGVLLQNEQVTDFDTGDIHVSGNLIFDAIGSAFQPTGNTLAAAPFHIASDAPPKDKKTDELMQRINNGEQVSNADMQYLVQQMLITAFKNDPIGFLTNGLPSTVPGFEGLNLSGGKASPTSADPSMVAAAAEAAGASAQTASGVSGLPSPTGAVPEPGTLILLAAAAGSLRVMRAVERRMR